MNDPKLAQTVVRDRFIVSTILRRTSARVEPPVPTYYEMGIWEWDHERRDYGRMLEMKGVGSGARGAMKAHVGACVRLAAECEEPQI